MHCRRPSLLNAIASGDWFRYALTMIAARLLPPMAAFAASAAVAWFWPEAAGPADSYPASSKGTDQSPPGAKPGTSPGSPAGPEPIDGGLGYSSPESRAAPGPTMDEVFAAPGLDRMLLMARFIQTAGSDDLKALIKRAQAERIYEPAFTDQAWLRWVELDPETALNQPDAGPAWWALAKLDPMRALTRAVESRPEMVASVLHSIGQADPALARRLLAEHPEIDPSFATMGILDGLKKRDPAAATALALETGGRDLETQFRNWMNRDPEQALAWMRGLANPSERRQVEDLALAGLIAKDPAAGLTEARQLPPGQRQSKRTAEAIAALARTDPAAARVAVESIAEPYVRQQALAALASSLASTDPAAVAGLVSLLDWNLLGKTGQTAWTFVSSDGLNSSTGFTGEGAAGPVLTNFMAAAPQATVQALASLASGGSPSHGPLMPGHDSGSLLSNAVQHWAGVQPEAASTWLRELPAGSARDEGIHGRVTWLMSESAGTDYPAALAWVGAASDDVRTNFYTGTLEAWKNKDPTAASAALTALPVSEEERDRLRQQIFPGGPSAGTPDPP